MKSICERSLRAHANRYIICKQMTIASLCEQSSSMVKQFLEQALLLRCRIYKCSTVGVDMVYTCPVHIVSIIIWRRRQRSIWSVQETTSICTSNTGSTNTVVTLMMKPMPIKTLQVAWSSVLISRGFAVAATFTNIN